MAELKADVLVLGAGMVGVGARLAPAAAGTGRHPGRQARTRRRRDQFRQCRTDRMRVGLSLHVSAGFRTDPAIRDEPRAAGALPVLRPADFLPWLVRYFLASSPERALHSAMAELPLIRRSLIEHEALIAEAGVPELLRRTGWIKLFRSDATLANAVRDFERAKAIWRRGRGSRRQGDCGARAQSDRRVRRRDPFAGARIRPRSRRIGQSLCGAVQAQGRTLSGGRRQNARTARRRMAHRRRQRRHRRARNRGGAWDRGPIWCLVRSDIRSRSASSAATICIWRRAAMPCSIIPCSIRISAICWRR